MTSPGGSGRSALLVPSMSGAGGSWHIGVSESFFATLSSPMHARPLRGR